MSRRDQSGVFWRLGISVAAAVICLVGLVKSIVTGRTPFYFAVGLAGAVIEIVESSIALYRLQQKGGDRGEEG